MLDIDRNGKDAEALDGSVAKNFKLIKIKGVKTA